MHRACELTDQQRKILDPLIPTGKQYRKDKQQRSIVSSKTGYVDEFILCSETQQPLLAEEAERCEITNKLVVPGLLMRCEVTGKKVLPSLLEKSAVTGRTALAQFFVSSSISGARAVWEECFGSASGKYCLPTEAKLCMWSGNKVHPDDLRTCDLTRVNAHFAFMSSNDACRLTSLISLLSGLRRKADKPELWTKIAVSTSKILDCRSQVEAAILSPSGDYLAVCVETRNWLGLKTRHAGLLYAIRDQEAVGRIVVGKRTNEGWILEKLV